MSPEILVPFFLFMTPVLIFFTQRYFRLREKQLEAQTSGRLMLGAGPSEEQNKKIAELTARIENLESILIELDSSPRLQSRAARAKLSDGDQAHGALPSATATPRLPAANEGSGSPKKSSDE